MIIQLLVQLILVCKAIGISITSLNNTSIFIEELQSVYMYHSQIKLIVGIDVEPYVEIGKETRNHVNELNELCEKNDCDQKLALSKIS